MFGLPVQDTLSAVGSGIVVASTGAAVNAASGASLGETIPVALVSTLIGALTTVAVAWIKAYYGAKQVKVKAIAADDENSDAET